MGNALLAVITSLFVFDNTVFDNKVINLGVTSDKVALCIQQLQSYKMLFKSS